MHEVLLTVDDDEERALAQTDGLLDLPIRTDEIRVTILHVFEENPEGASATQIAAVRRAHERLEEAGIEVEIMERSGEPGSVITSVADELDADLVTVSGRKRSPAGKMVFGSVAQGVILGTDRSVLVCDVSEE